MMSLRSQRFLFEWFGIHGGREVFDKLHRTRRFLACPEQLEEYARECSALRAPCFVSVQPYRERDRVFGLEKLFFDFDSEEDPARAWSEARMFAHKLWEYYSVMGLLVSSGRKGYHLYVWLKNTVQIPIEGEEFIKTVYELLQSKLLKGYRFETLDRNPLGDIKRLARLPYSIHEETGKTCQPVNLNHEPVAVTSLEEYRRHGFDLFLVEKVCREVKARDKIRAPRLRSFKPSGKVRPCIEAAVDSNLEGGLGHSMRLAIACEYLNKGSSVEETARLFVGQPDYNQKRSIYFVGDAKAKGYKPFRCSTISKLGFCLRKSCPVWKRRVS